MSKYDQDRIDMEVLIGCMDGHSIGPFRFAVPDECLSNGKRGSDDTPGVYLRGWGSGTGGPGMYGLTNLLTKEQAREIADLLDRFAALSFRCDGPEMDNWPHTYRELTDAFYEALGRRMGLAITASSDRASRLREVRAALTGEIEGTR